MNSKHEIEQPHMDQFDRSIGALHGLPDVLHSKPSTIQVVPAKELVMIKWMLAILAGWTGIIAVKYLKS